jgi:hypothetical protein
MNNFTIAMISVLVVMVLGIVSMVKGGEFNQKYGNKIMQARVMLQGIAIALIALAVYASQK